MNKKALVVDDEEGIRNLLRIHLVKRGYEVKEAADGVQALEQLNNDEFSLLISDIFMPNMDGWQLLKKVRLNPKTKDIPVMILSVINGDFDMFKGYDLGANYYMTKPFSMAQLLCGIQMISEDNFESTDYIKMFQGSNDIEG